MDSSRFSLEEAFTLLKPHLPHLPFNRLEDLMQVTAPSTDGVVRQFTIIPQHLMSVPLGLGLDSMVRVVYTDCVEAGREVVALRRLLLEKKPAFFSDARWLLWSCNFKSVKSNARQRSQGTHLVSTFSRIVPVTEMTINSEMILGDAFHIECWETLERWVKSSVAQRAQVNKELLRVALTCGDARKAIVKHQASY